MKPRPVPIPISARATIASAGSGATSARPLNAIDDDEPDESGAPRPEAIGGASSGICIARWVTKSAVVNSPTTARLTS